QGGVAAGSLHRQRGRTGEDVAVGVVEVDGADGLRRIERDRAGGGNLVAEIGDGIDAARITAGPVEGVGPVAAGIDVPGGVGAAERGDDQVDGGSAGVVDQAVGEGRRSRADGEVA